MYYFYWYDRGIIEALERNIKLIHITQDNEIDMYNKDIWPNIIAEKLYDNIYIYKLKKSDVKNLELIKQSIFDIRKTVILRRIRYEAI